MASQPHNGQSDRIQDCDDADRDFISMRDSFDRPETAGQGGREQHGPQTALLLQSLDAPGARPPFKKTVIETLLQGGDQQAIKVDCTTAATC
jgi:hypothetical protein